VGQVKPQRVPPEDELEEDEDDELEDELEDELDEELEEDEPDEEELEDEELLEAVPITKFATNMHSLLTLTLVVACKSFSIMQLLVVLPVS